MEKEIYVKERETLNRTEKEHICEHMKKRKEKGAGKDKTYTKKKTSTSDKEREKGNIN